MLTADIDVDIQYYYLMLLRCLISNISPVLISFFRITRVISCRPQSGTVDKIGKNGFQFPENKFGQFSQSDSLKGLSQPNCVQAGWLWYARAFG